MNSSVSRKGYEAALRLLVRTERSGDGDMAELLRRLIKQEIQNALEERQVPMEPVRKTRLREFFLDFHARNEGCLSPNTLATYRSAVNEFVRVVGDIGLEEVGAKEIETFVSKKTVEASDFTARKHFASLSSVFAAARRWKVIKTNPFDDVRRPKVRQAEPVYFTETDFRTLIGQMNDPDLKDITIVAGLTGLRLNEILNLHWDDVDFARKTICVKNTSTFTTKSKRNRYVPMHDQLPGLLMRRKETAACDLVFHRDGKALSRFPVSRRFKEHVRRSGLNQRLHFHSLRHTFATWLVQSGVSIFEVQKLLGHSSIGVTQIYAHLASSELHSSVNKIEMKLD